MTQIVEIHWNAKPHLARLGVKVGSNALDPRAERLFDEVRSSVADAFPGCVTLVRIAVRTKNPEEDIRIMRNGTPDCEADLAEIRARIAEAIERVTAAAASAAAVTRSMASPMRTRISPTSASPSGAPLRTMRMSSSGFLVRTAMRTRVTQPGNASATLLRTSSKRRSARGSSALLPTLTPRRARWGLAFQ